MFEVVEFDIVDVPPPYELLPLVFIALALFAPLELYVFMLLLDDPPHAISTTLAERNNVRAKIFFIDCSPQRVDSCQFEWPATFLLVNRWQSDTPIDLRIDAIG